MSRILAVALVAIVGGCGQLQTPSVAAPGAMSWTLPQAKSVKKLLYAGSGGQVDVYDFDSGMQVGTLAGFNDTHGECVDKIGDVFVTTFSIPGGAVLEYAHGGDSPIRTYATDGHPIGCAIDRAGDLAVNNGLPSGGSDVEVWTHATGNPARYENEQDCGEVWPPGYDSQGNLFMEVGPNVCELPAGGSSLIPVTFNHSLGYPASVVWDGKHLALTDQDNGAIYRVKETPNGLDVIGTTYLHQHCGEVDVLQPFIVGTKNTPVNDTEGTVVVGGNEFCSQLSELTVPIAYWHYTRGGEPFKFAKPRPGGVSGDVVSIAR